MSLENPIMTSGFGKVHIWSINRLVCAQHHVIPLLANYYVENNEPYQLIEQAPFKMQLQPFVKVIFQNLFQDSKSSH